MGIIDKVKGIFRRKSERTEIKEEKEPLIPYISPPEHETFERKEPLPRPAPEPFPLRTHELAPELRPEPLKIEPEAEISNLRAKVDLLLVQVDSIRTQNQTINERLRAIEKALAEMKGIRYY